MSSVDISELPHIREKFKDKKIVFCSGSFDLTHAGHVLFFEDCKKYGDVLVVMVGNDFNLRNYKGQERPILNEHVRLKIVSSLKPVDYAFLDLDRPDKDLLANLKRVFTDLKPDFYIINDDAYEIERRKEILKSHQTELVILPRTCPPEFESISSSGIIKKIKGK